MPDHEPPVYAHHVRALLARQQREDREAIGATLRRRRFTMPEPSDSASRMARGGRRQSGTSGVIDFFIASPLTGRDRQTGRTRVPHFDMKPIARSYAPTSADGAVHHRYRKTPTSGPEHFDYVTDGAKVERATHLDYIRRETAVEDLMGALVIDVLDEQELRDTKNRLSIYSNIKGWSARQRSLFEAAERIEASPRHHALRASTADLEQLQFLLRLDGTPPWLTPMVQKLADARQKVERAARDAGTPVRHASVDIATVTAEQAYDRLTWLDRYPTAAKLVHWQQGRSGRIQHRFVAELPDGLTPFERHAILKGFCDTLAADGWMVVGAIHQPDATNDRRNFHMHVDGYDRPAEWLDDHGCWDFEHVVRRNGKDTYPDRQNKVRYRSESDPMRKVDTATLLRERFIGIVNDVVGDRPDIVRYVAGTYRKNAIPLTPLNHLGNRTIAAEKNGIATEAGSLNARRIFADEAAACEARAEKAGAALDVDLGLMRAVLADDRAAMEGIATYERLKRRTIRRRLEAELADVVIAMARSRADAVVRERTVTPGRRRKPRPGDADLLAAARRHLEWVERQAPASTERDAEQRLLARLDARAAEVWKDIDAAMQRVTDRRDRPAFLYVARARKAEPRLPAGPSAFDDRVRGRLADWLNKHLADPSKVVIGDGDISLGAKLPPSIDTLMRRFAHEPRFQTLFSAEAERRRAQAEQEAAAMRSTAPMPAGIPVPIASTARSRGEPSKTGTSAPSAMAAMQAELRQREADLREAGLKRLRDRQMPIMLTDGRYTVDLAGLPDGERQALSRPAFDKELQRLLAAAFAIQQSTATSPGINAGTPSAPDTLASLAGRPIGSGLRAQAERLRKEGSAAARQPVGPTSTAKAQGEGTHFDPRGRGKSEGR